METFKRISEVVQFSSEKMKKNGLFETERMFCDLYCFEPGQEQHVHAHEGSDKIYFVLQGEGLFQVGEEKKTLAKDEIAVARSGEKHGVKNAGAGRLVLLVFMAPRPVH
jgi:quercetin dioxygenase-like cupin family protein